MRPTGLDELAGTLGYEFADPALLTAALTHTSANSGTGANAYQRLEFLGDRVLGLLVADMLYRRHAAADEGELALRFNSLVRRETLAGIAREIFLGRHLVLGAGEAQAGGREKDAILADSLEAVLGAVYLDGGLDPVRALVERCWGGRIESQLHAPRDPKTMLQEWSQGEGRGLPEYVEVARTGPDHAPVFTVEARIEGTQPARGVGASKREAERNAARALFERETVRP
jgi:ribonuclease III